MTVVIDGTTGITAPDSSISNDLVFTGTGNRITGDFSTVTIANRVAFQTSTANSNTIVSSIPSGTATITGFDSYNNSDTTNCGRGRVSISTVELAFDATITGTGTYLPVTFKTGGSERVRIDTSGNVGIGTTSMTRFFNLYDTTTNAQTAYFKSTQASGGAGFVAYNNGGEAATFQINGSSNTSYAGANSVNIGSITNNNLAFITNNTERARIASDGKIYIACTAAPSATVAGVRLGNPVEALCAFSSGAQTTETYQLGFYNGNGLVGRISTNGSATSYVTSSDYRLKEDIAPMTGALSKVALLKPCTYKWKVDGSDGQGFIAHELAEVEAGCVTGAKDAVDEEGNPQYQGIDTSFLVATLAAAIQEQQTLITALTARITALEQA